MKYYLSSDGFTVIDNVYFGKRERPAEEEPPEPTEPPTIAEILEKIIDAEDDDVVACTARNNPKYLDDAIAQSEARRAKRKADLKAAEEKRIRIRNLVDKYKKYL